jgi:hypothetical protein
MITTIFIDKTNLLANMPYDFDIPLITAPKNYQLEELREINSKLDNIVGNIEAIRESSDEQSSLLMLILAVHASNAGLIKPDEHLAGYIKQILASRRIEVEVAGSEPSKDQE